MRIMHALCLGTMKDTTVHWLLMLGDGSLLLLAEVGQDIALLLKDQEQGKILPQLSLLLV